jgi:F-type H+-transporting ATPase subunit delta
MACMEKPLWKVARPGTLCYTHADFVALSIIKAPSPRGRVRLRADLGPKRGRVDVSEPASISSGIAARYATAVFDIAKGDNGLDALEQDIDTLDAALKDSADFRDLIGSPVYSRDAQGKAVAALADKMGLSGTMKNTLGLMASKRRLFVLPQLVAVLREKIAEHKGEVTADVVSAKALTKTQSEKLSKTLAASVGKDVKINATVDESLIGGLVVKVGSRMIDTSIRSKLNSLQNAMKEVG